jgi:hypothetical protein
LEEAKLLTLAADEKLLLFVLFGMNFMFNQMDWMDGWMGGWIDVDLCEY